jgi:hypothetical protein
LTGFLFQVEIELADLQKTNEWIIGNIQHAGYYRVNYDSQNWRLLMNQLYRDHTVIGPVNRAELVDDAFNLGYAEWIDQLLFFDMIKYLQKEADPLPFVTAFSGLNTVANLITNDYEVNKLFQVNFFTFSWYLIYTTR